MAVVSIHYDISQCSHEFSSSSSKILRVSLCYRVSNYVDEHFLRFLNENTLKTQRKGEPDVIN